MKGVQDTRTAVVGIDALPATLVAAEDLPILDQSHNIDASRGLSQRVSNFALFWPKLADWRIPIDVLARVCRTAAAI